MCFKCKQKIDDGSIVCPYCGEYLNVLDRPQGIIKKRKCRGLGKFWRTVGTLLMVISYFVNTTSEISFGWLGAWLAGATLYAIGRYIKYKNYDTAAIDKLSKSIKNRLAKENNEEVKLIAKSTVNKRVLLSVCFAGFLFLILQLFYYTYSVVVLLPILFLVYQSMFFRFNTIKTLYKAAKKHSDYHDISEIIAQETYNEKENGKVAKATLVCLAAFAVAIGGFVYLNLNSGFEIKSIDGGATLVQYKPGLLDIQKGVEIPEEIDDKKIISISENAFSFNIYIPSVILPDTVTEIGESVFYDCRSLKKITLSSKIKKLPEDSFNRCYSLSEIDIPQGVIEFGKGVFEHCKRLRSIKIPKGVTTIPENAFSGCISLDIIDWHDDITEIKAYAFSDCDNIITAGFPSEVTEISDHLFDGCNNLQTVYISRGITKIGGYAFNNCKSLYYVYVPDSVTEIGDSAFYDCDALKKISLPKGIKVHTDAFDREVTKVKDKLYTDEIADKIDREFNDFNTEKLYILYDKEKGKDIVYSPENNKSITIANTERFTENFADNMDLFVVETPAEFLEYLKSARDAGMVNVLYAFDSKVASEAAGEPRFVSYNFDVEELIKFYEENPNKF